MYILLLIITTVFAVWIFFDAQTKNTNVLLPYLWLAAVLFFPIIAIPSYFVLKGLNLFKKTKSTNNVKKLLCPKCGKENSDLQTACAFCSNQLNL
ncbi:MAG: hypothetical protein WC860_02700 [Candidatus Margulisiibacteriota bacterium]|jgi:hypothetical protein